MAMKIIKTFRSFIVSCKTYYEIEKTICIICRDGKFGLAEKRKNGKMSVIIDCEYDYIDSLCGLFGLTNMVSVYLNGKCGLYAFKYTVSSKSNKIDCKRITECEYDNIKVNQKSRVAIFYKGNKLPCCYYNLNSNKLSPLYINVIPVDEHHCKCVTEKEMKFIDLDTDSVVYSYYKESGYVSSERLSRNIYLFSIYNDESITIHQSDLVFFNQYLRTSYVIENIDYLSVTRNDFDKWEDNYYFTFQKDGKKYIIAVNDDKIDFDELRRIAKEVEYT